MKVAPLAAILEDVRRIATHQAVGEDRRFKDANNHYRFCLAVHGLKPESLAVTSD